MPLRAGWSERAERIRHRAHSSRDRRGSRIGVIGCGYCANSADAAAASIRRLPSLTPSFASIYGANGTALSGARPRLMSADCQNLMSTLSDIDAHPIGWEVLSVRNGTLGARSEQEAHTMTWLPGR